MTATSKNHPCFTCPLVDCDDRAFGCPLQVAKREYSRRHKLNLPISDELRERYGIAYRDLFRPERNAILSEVEA